MIYKIQTGLLLSLSLSLVFFVMPTYSQYVVNTQENLCWDFERWDSENPNWLQAGWFWVNRDEKLALEFSTTDTCISGTTQNCCKSLWFRYAWIPIGVENISQERKAAEYLWSKKIIESQSLSPDKYRLDDRVSRKEVMKIIMGASEIEVTDTCEGKFQDVVDDWGCKYIESALENEFISENDAFRPSDDITQSEALKLVFQSRNIQKSYQTNSWQEDYISSALYLGYIDNKFSDYNILASRWWIFWVLARSYPDFKNW